jgi:hypothetical protein
MPSILCLLVVWLGISLAVRMASSGKPSVATTLSLLDEWPNAAGNAEARRAWIALFSSRLSGLEMDSRHLVLMEPSLRLVFVKMSPEDQSHFLEAIEPPGMKKFLEGSTGASGGRFRRLLRQSSSDLEALKTGSTDRFQAMLLSNFFLAELEIGKVGFEGAFKDSTDPLTRFDLRPLIERMQKYSQQGR